MVENELDHQGDFGKMGARNWHPPWMDVQSLVLVRIRMTPWLHGYSPAGVQPRLIQGIRSGDGVGDLFIYLFIKDLKSNRMRIAQ